MSLSRDDTRRVGSEVSAAPGEPGDVGAADTRRTGLLVPGRVVLVMLHDGTLLKGELIAAGDHYTIADVAFEESEIETIDDAT